MSALIEINLASDARCVQIQFDQIFIMILKLSLIIIELHGLLVQVEYPHKAEFSASTNGIDGICTAAIPDFLTSVMVDSRQRIIKASRFACLFVRLTNACHPSRYYESRYNPKECKTVSLFD